MEEFNFGRVNKDNLKKNYIKALKDPEFINVVNGLDVADEVKFRYTSSLQEIANINKICSECKCLEDCPYDIKGVKKIAKVENDIIKFMYIDCPYKEKNDKAKEYLKNVTVYKMNKEIREASFKNVYKDDSSRLEVIKYLKKFYDDYKSLEKPKGLYLYGNFGCGKTYLVSALFNELAKKNVRSTIVYFPEFLRSLKASFGSYNDDYEEKFDEVKYADLLLLDDIGAEKMSEWARDEVLGVILQYRMEEKLPTFFTSNRSISELEEHLKIGNSSDDIVNARRIIERVKYLTNEMEMNSINRRV